MSLLLMTGRIMKKKHIKNEMQESSPIYHTEVFSPRALES
jgi:hypothetical protein